MPGKKIYDWKKEVWIGLFLLVVPGFFLLNFVL